MTLTVQALEAAIAKMPPPSDGQVMLMHPVHYWVLEACNGGRDLNRRGKSDRRKMKRIYRLARQRYRGLA